MKWAIDDRIDVFGGINNITDQRNDRSFDRIAYPVNALGKTFYLGVNAGFRAKAVKGGAAARAAPFFRPARELRPARKSKMFLRRNKVTVSVFLMTLNSLLE